MFLKIKSWKRTWTEIAAVIKPLCFFTHIRGKLIPQLLGVSTLVLLQLLLHTHTHSAHTDRTCSTLYLYLHDFAVPQSDAITSMTTIIATHIQSRQVKCKLHHRLKKKKKQTQSFLVTVLQLFRLHGTFKGLIWNPAIKGFPLKTKRMNDLVHHP